ncbi:MAG: HEAT repeat domain-containing protein [Anaerosomatales bacterium]|nr:HEAT repeat domain-containing protein [Anaerosomatales bacterium]
MAGSTGAKRAPGDVEAFVKQLVVAYKAVRLYPPASSIPMQNAQLVVEKLRPLQRRHPEVRMVVSSDGLFFEGLQALPGEKAFVGFAREIFRHGVGDVRFHSGVASQEIATFLRAVAKEPLEIAEAGGFSSWLWEHDVHQITVGEMETKVVDADEAEEPALAEARPEQEAGWPPEPETLDQLLESVRDLHDRDQRVLVRFLLEPKLVGKYLEHVVAQSAADPAARLAERIFAMAKSISREIDEEQGQLSRSAAEAIMALDPGTRARLIAEHLIPRARIDDGVAGVLAQVALDDLCAALVAGVSEDQASREGLSRALLNLALIGIHSRQEVAEAAIRALSEAGVPEAAARGIVHNALPERVEAPTRQRGPAPADVEEAVRLVDMAAAETAASADPALDRLREEIALGLSDADVFRVLIRLLMLERRSESFASLLALVEDGLPVLLDRDEFEAVSEAVSVLAALRNDGDLPDELRNRVRAVLGSVATTERLQRLCALVRITDLKSGQQEACARLVRMLGDVSIEPLLEVLASEQDMSARKALVEMISAIASSHVEQLGKHVEDSRWFFVRNVVAILGSTRDPAVLPYLARTLRHSDARVRRETVRALASIRDRYAEELLVAALTDDDAQNVAIVARYLGTLGVRGAVPALVEVAKGAGQGNRDTAPRVEAIEALARIGAKEALPVLEQLSSKRGGLLRGQRGREVAAAAEAAVRALTEAPSDGGR